MTTNKRITNKEAAEKYARILEKRRAYYKAHAEERKAYQRRRYAEMRLALREKEAKK